MEETAKIEKALIEIPFGLIEYTAFFQNPIVRAFSPPTELIEVLFSALKPHGFLIDGVETKNTTKVSDYTVEFRRTAPEITFSVTPGKLVVSANNLSWDDKKQFLEIVGSGTDALFETARVKFESQSLILAMHVQLKNKPRQEITAPLLSPAA